MSRCLSLIIVTIVARCATAADPPPLPREFRGVWVATVANIDWPSKPGLPAETQKAELIALLDRCKAIRLNAVVFQIRPMCDAFYYSQLEPMSGFLTGVQGKYPGYDPLEFAVQEAHARGLELHAWFNPYRAWAPSAKGEPAANHLVRTRPDLAKKYGKHHWLNPTHPDVQKHSLNVVLDVVKRYDLDGIHMDDYFYPYPEQDENKKEIPFPDDDTWATYQKAGGALARDDWRRDAVNQFVKTLYTETHKAKPWVKVGISPFGIWRPGHPATIKGFDQYGKLYADAKLWLNEGWVDYFTPQLYWEIDKPDQSYPVLLDWWAKENTKTRHLWVGNSAGRHAPAELSRQIDITRKSGTATGNVIFSMKSLTGAKAETLKERYKESALPPSSPWLTAKKPVAPSITEMKTGSTDPNFKTTYLTQLNYENQDVRWIVFRQRTAKGWETVIHKPVRPGFDIVPFGTARDHVVTVVDRFGQESPPGKAKED